MIKKCFSTLGCTDYSLDKVIDTAQAHGMDCVEIRALENEIDLPSYFIKNGITPEELKRRCHKSGNLP
jgi:sugar phosphate isomerase/epimerase